MLTVKCFARYRDLLGFTEQTCATAATLGDLLMDPRFERLPKDALLAVNQTFADRATPLRDGDEVALMPPVSGG
ncbi:molybdopterin synthase sulfur carrier subunit [Geothrix limicola]|uniref:Molybdopterin synthase sulfur carrier subunit n=1 Tax=Geothrix limicola TaxID=2927978 RepID=A0ABQ5QBU7_9BACT|nr:MoaD/ThiS family protein [Geothrix limicola]GLH72177.1 molybdopterin synthase sulfur carrier subunit [Geothrix limicola]